MKLIRPALIIFIGLVILGGIGYYVVQLKKQQTTPASITSSVATKSWPTYSGSGWSIAYPSDFSIGPSIPGVYLVHFKSPTLNTFIDVHYAPMSAREASLQKSSLQGAKLLDRILQLEEAASNINGETTVIARHVSIGTENAIQYGLLDQTSNIPFYVLKTTFARGNQLIDITLMVNNATGPTKNEMDEYNGTLLSFKFQ
jgi:hypothetical protein